MHILIVDNNDSFTYNIAEMIRSVGYSIPDIVSYDRLEMNDIDKYDRIILSPGPGLPDEYPMLNKLLDIYGTKKSILGICLGHQAICRHYGAGLANLSEVVHGQPRKIQLTGRSRLFNKIPTEFTVGLYHSWKVMPESFPGEIDITGRSEEGIIMSVEHRKNKLFGLQFHPESVITEHGKQIIINFLNL